MKILVTGGAGFIGRHVVKELLKQHEVWVIDNLARGKKENLAEFSGNPKLHVTYDTVTSVKALEPLFKSQFDVILHLASTCDVQLSIDHPEEAFSTDIEGTFNVLEMTRKHCPQALFIFMSSSMVYDEAREPIHENSPLKASSPYAAAKIAGEELTLSYRYTYGLRTMVLRPFNTYGPYGFVPKDRGEAGVILRFLRRKAQGKPLHVFGTGEQTRDLMYVEDCVRFILAAMSSPRAIGQVINAGTGREISVNELADLISGGDVPIEHVEHHHPQSEIARLVCDYGKAKELLGWEPEVSLEEGIRKTQEWIANHPEVLRE